MEEFFLQCQWYTLGRDALRKVAYVVFLGKLGSTLLYVMPNRSRTAIGLLGAPQNRLNNISNLHFVNYDKHYNQTDAKCQPTWLTFPL